MNKFKYLFIVLILFSTFFYSKSYAAIVTFIADKQNVRIGDEVNVNFLVDSQGKNINAVQGIVRFSGSVVQLSSVDRTGSALNFWVEDPNISNNSGTMSFTGGVSQGVSGSALKILSMKFKVTGAGSSDITFSDGIVTSDDGLGTNVLNTVNKISIIASTETVAGASLPVASTKAPEETVPVVVPKVIVRTPVPTGKLPIKPVIEISSYPEEELWYNSAGDIIVFWNLPTDVTGVTVLLDQNPNSIPTKLEKELTDGKNLGIPKEGVWYVHVRFKNDVGFGSTAHHKIALDLTSPLQFNVNSIEGVEIDIPQPTLKFSTQDSLSGLDHYNIIIDGKQIITSNEGKLKLPVLEPGEHTVVVSAYDKAGNHREASINLTIKPIESPVIKFVTRPLYSNSNNVLTISGSAIPNTTVLIKVSDDGPHSYFGEAAVDAVGNWIFTLNAGFDNETYNISVRAKDSRGALSLPVYDSVIVTSKPILKIGALELTLTGAIILLSVLLVLSVMGGFHIFRRKQRKIDRKIFVTKQDVFKITQMMNDSVKKMKTAIKTPDIFDDEFFLGEIEDEIKKIETYVEKEIDNIRK